MPISGNEADDKAINDGTFAQSLNRSQAITIPAPERGRTLLLELDPDAVLIVSSGYSNDTVIANYQNYGFSGSISKPFYADTLARELERLIAGRR